MKAHDYNAYVKIAVLRVQEDTIYCDHPQDDESDMDEYANDGDDPRRNDGGDTWKLLATRVLAALCDCTGGRAGQCHHVGMVLQLVRLLKCLQRRWKTSTQYRPPADHASGSWITAEVGEKHTTILGGP